MFPRTLLSYLQGRLHILIQSYTLIYRQNIRYGTKYQKYENFKNSLQFYYNV